MRVFGLVLFLTATVGLSAQSGWARYRLVVNSPDQAQRLVDSDIGLFSERVAVGTTDVYIGPDEMYKLWALGMPYRKVSELPDPAGWDQRYSNKTLNYRGNYYRYDDIIAQYEEWRIQNPTHVKRFQIGTSILGRPIWAYSVRSNALFSGARRSFVVNCGIHAREWISPAIGMYVFKKTIDSAAIGFADMTTDFSKRAMLRGSTFYFVPVNNPDGYEYCWTNNRMWRKNRRDNPGSSYGVDLNRNFAKAWGGSGSSGNYSSETYRGTAPFSEPESQALVFLANRIPRMDAFIDFHSYGEYVLWPWSYTTANAPGQSWLATTGLAMKNAIQATHGHAYTYGHSGQTLYLAAGVTDDYFYDLYNTAAYTIELRDTGQNGFLLPESQISDTQDEAWAGFVALAVRMTNR
ncbi:MAG: hypothetical protein KF812_01900 [Fimbriimonadaceae bacterium]|nr:hypothetical protein [Fimbriimonadaceae bacterium]